MQASLGPSPGASRYPEHQIRISANPGQWTASIRGRRIAASDRTLVVDESRFERTVYFPAADVCTDALLPSDSRTTCPFKGEAQYFAADIDGKMQDVAWFYPAVYDEVSEIAGHVAFYTPLVDVREVATHD